MILVLVCIRLLGLFTFSALQGNAMDASRSMMAGTMARFTRVRTNASPKRCCYWNLE